MNVTVFRMLEVAVYALLNLLPYMALALWAFKDDLRYSRRGTVLLSALLGMIQIGIGLCAALFFPAYASIITLIGLVSYIAFYSLAVHAKPGKLAFMLFLVVNYASLVVTLSKCLEYAIFSDLALESYRYTFSLMTALVQAAMLPLLGIFIKRRIRPVLHMPDTERLWRYLWLIPFTFYLVWFYATYAAATGTAGLQMAIRPTSSFFLLLINCGFLLVYYLITCLLEDSAERTRLGHENNVLSMQILQLAHLEERMEETRRARHNLRQHVALLREYCAQGNLKALSDYLKEYRKALPLEGTLKYCNHVAINAVTVYYVDLARNSGANVSVEFALPDELSASNNDVAVLFGNLLENAFEAISRQTRGNKFLALKASLAGDALVITLDNSFDSIVTETEAGFSSTKHLGAGLGTATVKAIANKYDGIARFRYADGIFRASVLLKLPATTDSNVSSHPLTQEGAIWHESLN